MHTMRHHIGLSLNDDQFKAMQELQAARLGLSVTALFHLLLLEAYAELKNPRRGPGRPINGGDNREPDTEEVAMYPHPDQRMNHGRMLTRTELEGWYQLKGLPVPILS